MEEQVHKYLSQYYKIGVYNNSYSILEKNNTCVFSICFFYDMRHIFNLSRMELITYVDKWLNINFPEVNLDIYYGIVKNPYE